MPIGILAGNKVSQLLQSAKDVLFSYFTKTMIFSYELTMLRLFKAPKFMFYGLLLIFFKIKINIQV